MFNDLRNLMRLVRTARVLARYDALFPLDMAGPLPPLARAALTLAKIRLPGEARVQGDGDAGARLAAALEALGPTYVKLGQFFATRPDLVGVQLAQALSALQDRMPPFARAAAIEIIEQDLGKPIGELFSDLSEPVAAASIAQVHRAMRPADGDEPAKLCAVKVLRPGIEERFKADLDSFFFAARLLERVAAPMRRLRPLDVAQTLADSVKLEMDLRLEAAALSEMGERTRNDPGFRVPQVDWQRTARRVLTLDWVDGIPASDRAALVAAGHDMKRLGTQIIQSFLTHALRDGFFHADMHQGNLFVDKDGTLVAVDFGIMGWLDPQSRRFLAEILFGFLMRDYDRVAQIHFEAGYVPPGKSVHAFAQALRAIGEPIFGRSARDVSMGRLLAQLFQVTDQFDMTTQPQLILLQKTMVVVEGVARHFDPDHNIWDSAEPVLKKWMSERMGPEGLLQDAADGAAELGRVMSHLPGMLAQAERTARLLSDSVAEGGIKLHPSSAAAIADAQSAGTRRSRGALWVAALALSLIAAVLIFQA